MRRETWEETGIEVGEVIYHSSQPWPGIVLCTMFHCLLLQFTSFEFLSGSYRNEEVRREVIYQNFHYL